MAQETVVWMVPLREGTTEYKGVLTLEPPNVVFTERKGGERIELPLAEIRRVRRVRGSPVLRVALGDRPKRSEVAFYFTQPPPLRPTSRSGSGRPTLLGPLGGAMGGGIGEGAPDRTTKRVMRTNVGYLNRANATVKETIEGWVAAIEAAIDGPAG